MREVREERGERRGERGERRERMRRTGESRSMRGLSFLWFGLPCSGCWSRRFSAFVCRSSSSTRRSSAAARRQTAFPTDAPTAGEHVAGGRAQSSHQYDARRWPLDGLAMSLHRCTRPCDAPGAVPRRHHTKTTAGRHTDAVGQCNVCAPPIVPIVLFWKKGKHGKRSRETRENDTRACHWRLGDEARTAVPGPL